MSLPYSWNSLISKESINSTLVPQHSLILQVCFLIPLSSSSLLSLLFFPFVLLSFLSLFFSFFVSFADADNYVFNTFSFMKRYEVGVGYLYLYILYFIFYILYQRREGEVKRGEEEEHF